jgi:hypothetical protein
MADRIRLGLIGASVKGTWSARSHLPAVQASLGSVREQVRVLFVE